MGPRARRRAGRRGPGRDPRHGRPRPHLPRHHQRLRVHGRRDVDGLAGRRAAEGHGVHAVPPDDAALERRADHRGLPRRGRIPAQRRGRPVHVQLRAQRGRARLARRRLAGGADRDRRGARRRRLRAARPHAPRREADQGAAARVARAGDGLRRRRPDRRADPGAARLALPHGRRRHGHVRAHPAARPVRRRRGRLRLGARREPAGRQLPARDRGVRPPRPARAPHRTFAVERHRRRLPAGRACAPPSAG